MITHTPGTKRQAPAPHLFVRTATELLPRARAGKIASPGTGAYIRIGRHSVQVKRTVCILRKMTVMQHAYPMGSHHAPRDDASRGV
jgi:hypothetical protein